ncbi:LpxI family protein [Salibaculum halophilum]|uniref:LpxI family protein n=1 Tax=Salibaculum halophilum TaxID=1914408 RepID=UPI000A11F989|nr:UDP-2,3-diacylglucosamine diphosphatase LpxI [Salibaculum halophilum]
MLALVAGQGGLPPHLARVLADQGAAPMICEMEQFPSEVAGDLPRLIFRLETLGSVLATLVDRGVTQVCLAGAVQRPQVDPARIDAATTPLVPRLTAAMARGDDGTLREIIAIIEEHGLTVVGAHQIDPDLLPSEGIHCGRLPDAIANDQAAARAALDQMGRDDQGQAVVVARGDVIAREDARGTAAMLDDLATGTPPPPEEDAWDTLASPFTAMADWFTGQQPPRPDPAGGVLFKAPKPGQELRADMPLIGPDTADRVVRAGLAGIAVQAGGVLVLDRVRVVETLEAAGRFLWVMP